MKGKTKTYILLATVLAIWGAIGYKIVTGLNPEVPEVASANVNLSFNPEVSTKIDTFSIQTTNRDPFLGTLTQKQTSKSSIKKTVSKTKKTVCPLISYHGLIKKQNSSQKIFVININNAQHLLKQGQKIQDITFVKGNTKEIVVRCSKELKTIPIQ